MAAKDSNSGNEQGDLFNPQREEIQGESGGTAQPEASQPAGQTDDTSKTDFERSESRRVPPNSDIKSVVNEFKKIISSIETLTKIKLGDHDSLTKLERALKRIGNGSTLASAIDDLKSQLARALEDARKVSEREFDQTIAGFIKDIRRSGNIVREISNGWRVGEVQLEIRNHQCRFLYNKEPLVNKWEAPQKIADITKLFSEARATMKALRLPDTRLAEAVWDTYEACQRSASGSTERKEVLVQDFYKEFRITLARQDLSRSADRKFSYPEFPKWAFLYNLDLYISISSTLPPEKRLTLQTGSQDETRRFGYVTDGLSPAQDYRQHVYIVQPSQRTGVR
jgi:hypothetical protein